MKSYITLLVVLATLIKATTLYAAEETPTEAVNETKAAAISPLIAPTAAAQAGTPASGIAVPAPAVNVPVVMSPGVAPVLSPAPARKLEFVETFKKSFEFSGKIQSLLYYRNDFDFDRRSDAYKVQGQSVGLIGTFLAPHFVYHLYADGKTRIDVVYEMEVGLNLWAKNDPDQYNPAGEGAFRFANREAYVEGSFFDERLRFKVGYQKFYDPSGLFLGHWIGAASLSTRFNYGGRLSAVVGQLPTQTTSGILAKKSSFSHDSLLYGLLFSNPFKGETAWQFDIGAYGLHDTTQPGHTLDLLSAVLHAEVSSKPIKGQLDFVFQGGSRHASSADGKAMLQTAWALQASLNVFDKNVGFDINQLVLSPDDNYDANGRNYGFTYSGKSRSRTLILSEDELRDRGGNLDESISQAQGKFYLVRPGLSLTDIALSYTVHDFFKPSLIAGVGFAINKKNAANAANGLLGIEADLDLAFMFKDILCFHATAGLLVPGQAAAVFVNSEKPNAARRTNNWYMTEFSLDAFF